MEDQKIAIATTNALKSAVLDTVSKANIDERLRDVLVSFICSEWKLSVPSVLPAPLEVKGEEENDKTGRVCPDCGPFSVRCWENNMMVFPINGSEPLNHFMQCHFDALKDAMDVTDPKKFRDALVWLRADRVYLLLAAELGKRVVVAVSPNGVGTYIRMMIFTEDAAISFAFGIRGFQHASCMWARNDCTREMLAFAQRFATELGLRRN